MATVKAVAFSLGSWSSFLVQYGVGSNIGGWFERVSLRHHIDAIISDMRTEHRDKDFSGQDVVLDGGTFTGCTFRNCRVIFKGEESFSLVACTFDENIDWAFGGAAAALIEFLTAMYHTRGEAGKQVVERLFEQIRRGG